MKTFINHGETVIALLLLTGSSAAAQLTELAPAIAPAESIRPRLFTPESVGDLIAGPYSVQRGNHVGQLGVDHAWGHYWVTSADGFGNAHRIWKFNQEGEFVKQYDQDVASLSSAWGYRDGASDEAAGQLYFGWEHGGFAIHEYDPQTGDLSVKCVQTIHNYPTIRSLVRTPAGTYITNDFRKDIYEFNDAGETLNVWPNPGFSGYGCAYDASTDTYWWTDSSGLVMETDADMVLTGAYFDVYNAFTEFLGQGGLDIYADPRSPTGDAFVMLGQGRPDEIAVFEARDGASVRPSTGPVGCNVPPPPPPPPPMTNCHLDTTFSSNIMGPVGGIIYMDIAIGAQDLTIPGLEVNTIISAQAPFQIEMWVCPITYVGNECNINEWTLLATGDGQGWGPDNMSPVVFSHPPTLTAFQTYGVALVGVGTGHRYTKVTGGRVSYSDEYMSLRLGTADPNAWGCMLFPDSVWNGRYYYEPASGCPTCPSCACDFDTSTGSKVCDIFDFLAFQDGFVNADECSCDADTTTGIAVCDIFDFLAFQSNFVQGCP